MQPIELVAADGGRAVSSPVSAHPCRRGRQVGISAAQTRAVDSYGRRYHGHGAVHYFFGRSEARGRRRALGPAAEAPERIVMVTSLDH